MDGHRSIEISNEKIERFLMSVNLYSKSWVKTCADTPIDEVDISDLRK
jgi:hypothetical protein